jgi:hypothetical protein
LCAQTSTSPIRLLVKGTAYTRVHDVDKDIHRHGDKDSASNITNSVSGSIGSSVSLGSFPEPLGISIKSCVGGLDDRDEFELGYLLCPRDENVGVRGIEQSEDTE